MQPSLSSGSVPSSSPSASEAPDDLIVVPAGQPEVSPLPAPPLPVFVVVVLPPPLLVRTVPPAWTAVTSSELATATPTPRSPFIPAAACPGTVQRNSYLPARVNLTVSVCDCP